MKKYGQRHTTPRKRPPRGGNQRRARRQGRRGRGGGLGKRARKLNPVGMAADTVDRVADTAEGVTKSATNIIADIRKESGTINNDDIRPTSFMPQGLTRREAYNRLQNKRKKDCEIRRIKIDPWGPGESDVQFRATLVYGGQMKGDPVKYITNFDVYVSQSSSGFAGETRLIIKETNRTILRNNATITLQVKVKTKGMFRTKSKKFKVTASGDGTIKTP